MGRPLDLLIVDVLGGDLGPAPAILAVKEFAKDHETPILVIGEGAEFDSASGEADATGIRFQRCRGFVKQGDAPQKILDESMAESSTRLALRTAMEHYLRGERVAVVLSINAGALVLVAGHEVGRKIRRIPLACFLPTLFGPVVLIDCGVNLTPNPGDLVQWAREGVEILRCQTGRKVRIGLLSVGEERHKGTKTIVQAHRWLAQNFPEEFQGNVEADRIFVNEKKLDLLMADAYGGNILIKAIEGVLLAQRLIGSGGIQACNLTELLKEALPGLNWRDLGFSFLIGLEHEIAIVKTHGRSDQEGWYNAMRGAVHRVSPLFCPGEGEIDCSSHED